MYHREADQEGFLVLSGEAVLVVEGEERPLARVGLLPLPPGTAHVIVGAGAGRASCSQWAPARTTASPARSCSRSDEAAERYGASVAEDTTDGGAAYAAVPAPPPDGVPRRLAARVGASERGKMSMCGGRRPS